MTNETPDLETLKPAIQRRAAALMPMVEAALKNGAPSPSAKTIRQYEEAARRMATRQLQPEQIGCRSRRSFNLYRAALVYQALTFLHGVSAEWASNGHLASVKQAHRFWTMVEQALEILRRYPPGARDGQSLWVRPAGGPIRKGKRRGLSKLPSDWRGQMLFRFGLPLDMKVPLMITALTGLRPSELARSVLVDAGPDQIRISIQGAKVTETSGQPLRRLSFDAGTRIAKVLHILASNRGGQFQVAIPDPRAFSDTVRRLSRRLFPAAGYVASPYSLRHAFAADRKAEGPSLRRCSATSQSAPSRHMEWLGRGVCRWRRFRL
ncbi:site-specific integrase [Acidocella facilis]|uniref:hypothetical protein n=1 Tax=Acidocella facilis TaxID=525 RepID=UPI001F18BB9D|nr:hypothetical protein [Acidocella facilis]